MVNIEQLYLYTLTDDSGMAPNPYYGTCTLAACKPRIRSGAGNYAIDELKKKIKQREGKSQWRKPLQVKYGNTLTQLKAHGSIRDLGIWVAGVAGVKHGEGRLVYLMQITDIMTMEEYSAHAECKRPRGIASGTPPSEITNDDYAKSGDNLYDFSDEGNPAQRPGFHDDGNITGDLSGRYVLLSDNFVYYGREAIKDWKRKGVIGHSVIMKEDLPEYMACDIEELFSSGTRRDIMSRPFDSVMSDANFEDAKKAVWF